ncbi:alpha-amylase family glycosyl hydrolase [Cellvibrio sp. pealriver]|uniref:alpha-amylase family glycosyl hydrolase n=1 Tax=Cellvibrio sp. pealriver TaxID=1622269 RepID=UPI00066FF68F|nr:alpha-amylase family glycosyl hydrolase [Cellvibrio sp. pealriver]
MKTLLRPSAFLLALSLSFAFTGCSDPNTASKPASAVSASSAAAEYLSLPVNETANQWWHNAIFYEIWPRSFYDADGDGSGDFQGMTSKLDYLKSLGVNGIWLTPVFEAPSYHGYDFQDFYNVEADYGTMADFEHFIQQAHARDMKVILDLVLNHISDKHEWFIKSANKEPGYEDYFIWRDERPQSGWGQPWSSESNPAAVWHWNDTRKAYYYGAFGGSQPDLNLTKQVVIDELNKLATFWLEKGVDGFRLDAVRYAVEEGGYPLQADTQGTIDYWTIFSQHVKSIKPDAMLVAEAWADLKTVGRYRNEGKGLDSAFDFDFGNVIIDILNPAVKQSADFGTLGNSTLQQNRENLWANLNARKAAAPLHYFSPFLTNHDQNRIMLSLNNDFAKAKIAASLLMTTPGPLYLYYGEEIGVSQYKTGDDQYRRAIMQWSEEDSAGFNSSGEFWLDQAKWFPWMQNHQGWFANYWKTLQGTGVSVAAQAQDPSSLLNHYKRLISVRNSNPALQLPDEIRYYPVDNKDVWLVENIGENFSEKNGEKTSVWVVVNLNPQSAAEFSVPDNLRGERTEQVTGEKINVGERVSVPAAGVMIF